MDIITREIGCIPCRLFHGNYRQAECNHLLSGGGGYRLGHDESVPECEWHHRGLLTLGFNEAAMLKLLGPSRALHKKQFHITFGSDNELLSITESHLQEFNARTVQIAS